MLFHRESGILLHPTSLPGRYGMGEIGPQALRWVEELHGMGQRLWQVLPLGPTGFGDSPYQSLSTFAGAPLLVSIEALVEHGLVDVQEAARIDLPRDFADFGPAISARSSLLRRAARAFLNDAGREDRARLEDFCTRHADWLDDYTLFDALKRAHGGRPWVEWRADLRDRDATALARARAELECDIDENQVLQYLFAEQWEAVRRRATELGVRLIGDIPIFVAHDSADVWQRRDLFSLDARGQPTVVAGVPPDYFSRTGQRWGNPLYRWEVHRDEGYAWWTARVRRALDLTDVVRIDHFRGFAAYWEIEAGEPTAVRGRWVPGPGTEVFHVLRRELGELPIIAEDLGLITPDVAELRDRLGLPGMRVFQFAFGGDDDNPHLPENYTENCVAYSGTHDNDTTVGWIAGGEGDARPARQVSHERARLRRFLRRQTGRVPADLVGAIEDALLQSRASAVLFPLQDVLRLGREARMNTPGRAHDNWAWRFRWEQLDAGVRERMAAKTAGAGRGTPSQVPSPRSQVPES